ncbi:MAG: HNH endonuclease [Sandaracinaceae bacterium]
MRGRDDALRRRAVIERHGHRCAVPGCTHRAYEELHHAVGRAEGGTHDPELLVLLCTRHHHGAHEGTVPLLRCYVALWPETEWGARINSCWIA